MAAVGGANLMLRYMQMLAGWVRRLLLLEVATTVLICMIFFTQSDAHARFVFFAAVLPLGGLALISPGWRTIPPSFVLFSCILYLCAMLCASFVDAEGVNRDVWAQFYQSSFVIAFLLIVGGLVADNPAFLDRLFLFSGILAAVSAAINIYLFYRFVYPETEYPIYYYRLTTSIGMRAYANSTNISATYAVFFIAALATVVQRRISPLSGKILSMAAAILLVGVVLTQSRSAFLAVAVGITILALTRTPRFRMIVFGTAFAVVVLALAIPTAREAVFYGVFRGFGHRPEVWQAFLELIRERPWVGYGSFNPSGIIDSGWFLDQAHNIVLSAWFRGGVVSVAAMIAILLGGLYWSWRYWIETRQVVPLCVIATITTASMFDYQLLVTNPTWPWVTFWLPFGLCVGAEMAVRRARGQANLGVVPQAADDVSGSS